MKAHVISLVERNVLLAILVGVEDEGLTGNRRPTTYLLDRGVKLVFVEDQSRHCQKRRISPR